MNPVVAEVLRLPGIRVYAGIGSRQTPPSILSYMTEIAHELERHHGFILRSGGAHGADQAFEGGATKPFCRIFKHWHCTAEAKELAKKYHPNWYGCSPMAQRYHGRNAMIILGAHLDAPARAVICWTKDGGPTGGTGQGIRIAQAYGIPVINLHDNKWWS